MKRLLPAALLAVALVAAGCGGGDDPQADPTPSSSSPTSSATTPPVTPSSSSSSTSSAPVAPLSWKACDGGFQCATLTVPLDDAKPAAGTIGLAMVRKRATGKKIGSLFVNPGGPGASAVNYLEAAYEGFPAPLRERFDLVAFDPRGVGKSDPVRCETTAQLDAYFAIDPTPDTPAELTAYDRGNRAFTAGCERRSATVLPHVGTVEVAKDLDRARAAVGDDKLSYLGYSYGTSIGAAYLDAFPTHVRAMVLDGALDPTLTWDRLLEGQSSGFDVALKAFMANCEKTACAFRQAVTGDLLTAYDGLEKKIDGASIPGTGARRLGPGEFTLGVGAGLYSRDYGWPVLAQGLAEAEAGKGATLLASSDSYLDRTPSGYANTIEANFAVNCIDRPWPKDTAAYTALATKVSKTAPRVGASIALSGLGCASWPVAPVSQPHAVSGKGSPPVVVIGTLRDPATPYVWAQALAKQLDDGVLISNDGDGHTVYRAGAKPCIVDPVNAYLVSLKAPSAISC